MSDQIDQSISRRWALFGLGFRPFFLGAAIFAVVTTAIWMGIYVFGWTIQPYEAPPAIWHGHEMVFGYAVCVIAGFILTAVKNWTGIQTLQGPPLALLFLLWVLARLTPLFVGAPWYGLAAVPDIMFMLFLVFAVASPIVRSGNFRNLVPVFALLLLLFSNAVFYLGLFGVLANGMYVGLYSGLYLVLALIFVIGRRVIPLFIKNGVGYSVELTNRKWVDITGLLLFFLFWVTDLFVQSRTPAAITAGLLFLVHALRLSGWHTPGIWRKPLLWILFVAYGAFVAGFLLRFLTVFFDVSVYLSLHAFAYGGVGLMTIGMMSRVSLGHTGRSIASPPGPLIWVFGVLFSGAVVRVFLPLLSPSHYVLWIGISQALWITSFLIFTVIYAPVLLRPRIDGRSG